MYTGDFHLLWDDGAMVFQNDAFDVMSPQLPLLHRLCLEANRQEDRGKWRQRLVQRTGVSPGQCAAVWDVCNESH